MHLSYSTSRTLGGGKIMCLLDALDPCKIQSLISAIVLGVLGVFVGGYGGKFLYLHGNKDMSSLNWLQVVTSDGFWQPDITFWLCGAAFVTVVFCVIGALNYVMTGVGVAIKRVLYFLICDNCCWTCCTKATAAYEYDSGGALHHLSLEQFAALHSSTQNNKQKAKKSSSSPTHKQDIWNSLGDQAV